MAEKMVFVVNPVAWERSFHSWTGSPVGTWLNGKLQLARNMAQLEAPGPGKIPKNRTGVNYSRGILEKSILARQDRASTGRDLEGHVTSLAAYSLFVHGGTKPHVIIPRRTGGVLKFRNRVGTVVFARMVHHPGTAANPWMIRALKRVIR